MKNKKASSFHEFARNTSDAWDIGDDEEEDFSSPSFQTLNSKVALATAAQVLENHSKLRMKPERSQSTTSDVPASYKVIKSSSDAQLSRNSSKSILFPSIASAFSAECILNTQFSLGHHSDLSLDDKRESSSLLYNISDLMGHRLYLLLPP